MTWKNNLASGVAALSLLLIVPMGQAGNFDRALMQNSGKVLDNLGKNKAKVVGVMPFQVQKGSRKASYDDAPLSYSLPTRLENALIMALEDDALGVVRNAYGSAVKARAASYQTNKEAFDRLFTGKFPRAWDGELVLVDTFLTGTVVTSPRQSEWTEVNVFAFTKASWKNGSLKQDKVHSFKVRNDRLLLADLGYNYALSPESLKKGATARQRNDAVGKLVARGEGDTEASKVWRSEAFTPENIAGFHFGVSYGDTLQTIKKLEKIGSDPEAPIYELPPVPVGSNVVLHLRRTLVGDTVLGIVMKVNGMSTWAKQTADSTSCIRWVYRPTSTGRNDKYEGFYLGPNGSKYLPFRSFEEDNAAEVMDVVGNRVGWIDVDVFASREEKEAKTDRRGDDEDDELIATRGLPKVTRKDFESYQAALLKVNNQKRKPGLVGRTTEGGIIHHATEALPATPVGETALPNPELIGHISIRYRAKR